MSPVIAAAVLLASPTPAPSQPSDVKPTMHAALVAVLALQPLLASPRDFHAPENAAEVKGAIATLAGLRHGFATDKVTPTGAMATLFSQQLELAKQENERDRDEARLRLTTVTQLCLDCHLRRAADTDFQTAARLADRLGGSKTLLQKARLYATLRQYDEAIAAWKIALTGAPANEAAAFEQSEALRLAVAVAVRGKNDARATVELLEPQAARTQLPGFARRAAAAWLESAKAWRAEASSAPAASAAELVARARVLVATTKAEASPVPQDDDFVTLSRAAALLDEALRREPTGAHRGEALYLLGITSATTDAPAVWQLESTYLEACARENVKTPVGRRCLQRLEDRTWLAWRRSDAPNELLKTLWELSAANR